MSPEIANPILDKYKSSPIKQKVKLSSLITRPNITMEDVLEMNPVASKLAADLTSTHEGIVDQTEIQLKYEGYITREQEVAAKLGRLEDVKIPPNTDFTLLLSLSSEAKEKLKAIQPATIGQASRISGLSPSDISVLLIYLGR